MTINPIRGVREAARQPVAAVPTLAELSDDPAQLDRLPVDVLVALRAQLRRLDVDVDAEITRRLASPSPTAQLTAGPDQLLTVKEMMALAQVTRSWCYRQGRTLPFARKLGHRTLRFDEAGARRWLASRRP